MRNQSHNQKGKNKFQNDNIKSCTTESFANSSWGRGQELLGSSVGDTQRLHGLWQCVGNHECCQGASITEYDKLFHCFVGFSGSAGGWTCDAFYYLCFGKLLFLSTYNLSKTV